MVERNELDTQYSFCRICESLCGLEIQTKGNEIISILPDKNHVATNGFACPKGLKQHKMYSTPDRLRHPMRKIDGEWKKISWSEATEGIGNKIKEILDNNHPDSIAMYVGTAAGFGVLHPIFAQGFMDGIGSKSMFASASQDCSNKFAVSELMYGHPFTLTFPDIIKTKCLIIIGANPVVSKWSFLQVPNPSKHLKELERSGSKIYVVDPRKTETAKVAGQHVFIRPNTDPFFYLSFLNELEKQGGIQWNIADQHMEGTKQVLSIARVWPAERTQKITGIPVVTLRKMVSDYRLSESAVLYCSTGVNMAKYGAISFWIQEAINALSGNLDRPGGALVGKGIIDFPKFASKNGILLRKDRSRIGNRRSVNDTFPGGILADEILTPGDRQIKALFVTGGNPLITMANSNRLRKAFQNLELLVTLDIYPNETGSIGHYMLPCTSPLERPDLPFIFPLMLGLQSKPYLQATRAIVDPDAEQRDEASIYLDLCKASGVSIFNSRIAQWILGLISKKKKPKQSWKSVPQEFLLNCLLKVCRQTSFNKLLKKPHGTLRDIQFEHSFLGERILTESGKINLAPELLVKQSKQLEKHFQSEDNKSHLFKLISKRAVTTHNSWTHNIEEFVIGDRYTNYIYMHSEDAKKIGVRYKEYVDITTEVGKLRLPVKILDDLMPGTVSVPHGWGHQASLMQIAKNTEGVNVNILTADGPELIDEVSGMAHLSGIDVHISPAVGPPDTSSWSGLKSDHLSV